MKERVERSGAMVKWFKAQKAAKKQAAYEARQQQVQAVRAAAVRMAVAS